MIIESIVTTMDAQGTVNVAPMGVEWGADSLILKPFLETTTFRNIRATGVAVVNLTDDVLIFARAAISNPTYATVPAVKVTGVVLEGGCSWREVVAKSIDATPPRSRIVADIVHSGMRREFIGFNRARNAVLETAILATRTHILPRDQIRADVERLQVIVDKTAGVREAEAMALLTDYIRGRLADVARVK